MKRIAIIGSNPKFIGGISNYINNLIKEIDKSNYRVTWIYAGTENKKYRKKSTEFLEVKTMPLLFCQDLDFNYKVAKIISKGDYEIINSHAIWRPWKINFERKEKQRIVHTYHGTSYNFYKNHSKKSIILRLTTLPLLIYSYLIERLPIEYANKIICVSKKVKREIENLYGKRENIFVIRTGVDLKEFFKKDKEYSRENLKLEKDKIYGLYVGRGGYWTKGLDRVIKLSEEIYKINKKYRLIVGGADKLKTKQLLNKPFIIYKEVIARKNMPDYYNSADIFFCFSRYEGGAPTLVTGEAMASECLVVCSKDSEQEVILDGKNGLIVDCKNGDYKKEAEKIMSILKNKKMVEKMKNEARKTIEKISNEWKRKYLKVLIE